MALRLNPDTNQVERERVEYDVVTAEQLDQAINAKEAELTTKQSEQKAAQEALQVVSRQVSQIEEELEELKSDRTDFDEVVPSSEEDTDEEESDEVGADDGDTEAQAATPDAPQPQVVF